MLICRIRISGGAPVFQTGKESVRSRHSALIAVVESAGALPSLISLVIRFDSVLRYYVDRLVPKSDLQNLKHRFDSCYRLIVSGPARSGRHPVTMFNQEGSNPLGTA